MEVKVFSRAKINFFLGIKGRDEKGYHLIETVMASVDLGDIIAVTKNQSGALNVSCGGVEKEKNTAYLAAKLFKQKFNTCGFDIAITKNIPFGGGLGGSSADSAGTLYALCKLFDIDLNGVKDICLKCGSDTLYMLNGGFAKAEGLGEIITPFKCPNDYHLVLAKPRRGVSSAGAYAEYDRLLPPQLNSTADDVIAALIKNDFARLKNGCQNALYPASKNLLPQIEDVLNLLKAEAQAAFMSGSGSACAGVFKDSLAAQKCAQKIKSKGYWAVYTKTAKSGVNLL